ncbi:hypothetical protein C9374_006948 [Naegleria lovaniensis]|uniref:poly(ADP-ribose) glycohydrolase n=1 Tax=Naegleria lovaniensis TaxID=51637 RepID=A0AA88H642_NAELO|nr:uncharacterized protein C9374_006948 [Naegleria lovaniensis]KAG2393417.1 hypothetical protein C9374_006948 [Naegleria lovaniensis]
MSHNKTSQSSSSSSRCADRPDLSNNVAACNSNNDTRDDSMSSPVSSKKQKSMLDYVHGHQPHVDHHEHKRKRQDENESWIEKMRKSAHPSSSQTNNNNSSPFRVKPSKTHSTPQLSDIITTPHVESSSTPPTKSNYSSKKKIIEGWNSNCVKLPCHENNVYFQNNRQLSKWYLIKTLLQQKIRNVNDLIQVIRTINSSWTFNSSTFSSLQTLFENVYSDSEKELFFNKTLPCIQSLALELPNLFDKSSIPLLKQQSDMVVHLSRKQICCLLAHALFCTFPRRNQTSNPSDEYYSYPSINFITLFKKSPLTKRPMKKEPTPNNSSSSNKDSIFDSIDHHSIIAAKSVNDATTTFMNTTTSPINTMDSTATNSITITTSTTSSSSSSNTTISTNLNVIDDHVPPPPPTTTYDHTMTTHVATMMITTDTTTTTVASCSSSSNNETSNNNHSNLSNSTISISSLEDDLLIDEELLSPNEYTLEQDQQYEETSLFIEKLKTIFHYFNKMSDLIAENNPILEEIVSFERKLLLDDPSEMEKIWKTSSQRLIHKLTIKDCGTIEDDSPHTYDCCHVDFANKMIGGGVLQHGAVQEEIRFLINTECIVSRLFTEELQDNECFLIKNSKRFSRYEGYSYTYRFIGDYNSSYEKYSPINHTLLAIDALNFNAPPFRSPFDQFKQKHILREVNKIYCGFLGCESSVISTGNLGCGAFKGDFQLKFLCQLIAASQASFYHNNSYELIYFTFFDKELAQKLKTMHHLLVQLEVTVSELYNLMVKYWTDKKDPSHSVFDYVVSELVGF